MVLNTHLKEYVVGHLLPRVRMPAQYMGGERGAVCKDHREVRGTLCFAFPDTYVLGMSHHGLQVLYTLMNERPDWACERAFMPWTDMEAELHAASAPQSQGDRAACGRRHAAGCPRDRAS